MGKKQKGIVINADDGIIIIHSERNQRKCMYLISYCHDAPFNDIPYIIITVCCVGNDVFLERFILANTPQKELVLLTLRTCISSRDGELKSNPSFDLPKLLEHEFGMAKEQYLRWVRSNSIEETIYDGMKWGQVSEVVELALNGLHQANIEKIEYVIRNTYCEELKDFLGKILDLGLIVDTQEI